MTGPRARPAAESSAESATERPLLSELWHTKAWRLFPLLLAYMAGDCRRRRRRSAAAQGLHPDATACRHCLPAGVTLLIPHVPGEQRQYDLLGRLPAALLLCAQRGSMTCPPACQRSAHSCLLCLLCIPLLPLIPLPQAL